MATPSEDALARIPLFAELDAEELRVLAESMHERSFRTGERVTVEGAPGDGFFVVDAGTAEVTVQGQSRGTIGPGDYIGEIALMMGDERTATVTATSDLHCFGLSPEDFRALVEGNPTIAWKLLGSTMDRLS